MFFFFYRKYVLVIDNVATDSLNNIYRTTNEYFLREINAGERIAIEMANQNANEGNGQSRKS